LRPDELRDDPQREKTKDDFFNHAAKETVSGVTATELFRPEIRRQRDRWRGLLGRVQKLLVILVQFPRDGFAGGLR
jgi:hypothetical protein